MPLPTRRELLLGVAASALLASCRHKDVSPPRAPTAEELARDAAATAERSLGDEYAAALAAHPQLAARLAPLAEHHRRHVAVLVRPPTSSPGASRGASPHQGTAAETVRRLAHLEQRLASAHLAALPRASADLALLLASLAASASASASELRARP